MKNPESVSYFPISSSCSINTRRKMVAGAVAQSVTNQEIAHYWKQRRMLEEDHLYDAIKAAARLRARNLSESDYMLFEDSIKEEAENCGKAFGQKYDDRETMVGKDWWTKSKYAYLNQPAIKLVVDNPRRRSCNDRPRFLGCKSASPLNSKQWISRSQAA